MPTHISRQGPDRVALSDADVQDATLLCQRTYDDYGRAFWICDLVTDGDRERALESDEVDIVPSALVIWRMFVDGYRDGQTDSERFGPEGAAEILDSPDDAGLQAAMEEIALTAKNAIDPPNDGFTLEPDNSGDFWSAFYVHSPNGTPIAHLNLGDDGFLEVRTLDDPLESPLDVIKMWRINLYG